MLNDSLNYDEGATLHLASVNDDHSYPNEYAYRAVIYFPQAIEIKSIYLQAEQSMLSEGDDVYSNCLSCAPQAANSYNRCDTNCMDNPYELKQYQWYLAIYASSSDTYDRTADKCADFVQGNGTYECIKSNV